MTRPPTDYEIDLTPPPRRSGVSIVVVLLGAAFVLGLGVGMAIPQDRGEIGERND